MFAHIYHAQYQYLVSVVARDTSIVSLRILSRLVARIGCLTIGILEAAVQGWDRGSGRRSGWVSGSLRFDREVVEMGCGSGVCWTAVDVQRSCYNIVRMIPRICCVV